MCTDHDHDENTQSVLPTIKMIRVITALAINAGVGPVSSPFVFVPQILEKPVHVRVLINVPEQLQQKKRGRIIRRRAFYGVPVCSQRPDNGVEKILKLIFGGICFHPKYSITFLTERRLYDRKKSSTKGATLYKGFGN